MQSDEKWKGRIEQKVDSIYDELKELKDRLNPVLDDHSARLERHDEWIENYEKAQNRRLKVASVLWSKLNVILVPVAILAGAVLTWLLMR